MSSVLITQCSVSPICMLTTNQQTLLSTPSKHYYNPKNGFSHVRRIMHQKCVKHGSFFHLHSSKHSSHCCNYIILDVFIILNLKHFYVTNFIVCVCVCRSRPICCGIRFRACLCVYMYMCVCSSVLNTWREAVPSALWCCVSCVCVCVCV